MGGGGYLKTRKMDCAKDAPFWMRKKVFPFPLAKAKNEQKRSHFKGPNRGVKNIFFTFFLNRGVLRTQKSGCAKLAPFWMKKKYLRTPRKRVKRAKKSHF